MIISKAALQLVELCTPDKDIPVLSCICVEPTGVVVAMNRLVIAAMLPLEPKKILELPIKSSGHILHQTLFATEAIRGLLRSIPRDRKFAGMLEYCDMDDSGHVKVYDGKITSSLEIHPIKLKYIEYREEFRRAVSPSPASGTSMFNRKRFKVFVDVMEKVCAYDGDFSSMYMSDSNGEYITVRVYNERTEQWLIGLLRKEESNHTEFSQKESLLFNKPPQRQGA